MINRRDVTIGTWVRETGKESFCALDTYVCIRVLDKLWRHGRVRIHIDSRSNCLYILDAPKLTFGDVVQMNVSL